jgi:hypothetical protein
MRLTRNRSLEVVFALQMLTLHGLLLFAPKQWFEDIEVQPAEEPPKSGAAAA